MPLYLGHKNRKGLSVSPALQSLKIDLLRAPPSAVSAIARPTVTQPGYSSYVCHLPAFMKATNEKGIISLDKHGYTTNFPVKSCIDLPIPELVVDYNGPPPAKHVETLNTIGFERIKVRNVENLLRFPNLTFEDVRKIKATSPNTKTPAPNNTVNLDAFDTWVLVIRLVSCLLTTHMYPAFRDDGHEMEEVEDMVSQIMIPKRVASSQIQNIRSKVQKTTEEGTVHTESGLTEDEEMEDTDSITAPPSEVILRKARPVRSTELPWGTSGDIPNASGLFFPFIPELASYDKDTIPKLFEDFLFQSLGNTPEQQIDRFDRICAAWGIIAKTDAGNVLAHLGKVILMSLSSQARCFPIVQDKVYQGCVLSGGRFFVGLNGTIHRPLVFEKLQEETGSYHLHSRVLSNIAEIAAGTDDESDTEYSTIVKASSTRDLRAKLAQMDLSESSRDDIKKLAVHLRFRGDTYLAVNPQTISRVLDHLANPDEKEDVTIPLHHSALFSRDKVLSTLSAFGYQAPSFSIDNCPKISLKDSKPPTTLVIRQKPLEVATLDWKNMLETQEIKNNPRNLSRANRDRTITSNDKTMIWNKLKNACGAMGDQASTRDEGLGYVVDTNDGLDDW